MRTRIRFRTLVLLTAAILLLGACGLKEDRGPDESADTAPGEPKEGGIVVGAMATAPTGMFNPIFYEEAYDEAILRLTHESLVSQNDQLEFVPQLAKKWETNEDQTEITFQLEEGVKWHDGEEFTAEDVVFTYQMMSDPLYVETGGFRTDYVQGLKGYDEYNAGDTEKFEGVTAIDPYTVKFSFAEPNVTPLYSAGFQIIPKHIFGEIPIQDIPKSDASLKGGSVIGTGPFKLTKIVDRQQYVFERNDEYWKGRPHLEKIVWKVVDEAIMTGLLKTGDIDFVADPNGMSPADYKSVQVMGNLQIIEQPEFGNQFLGFKMNYRDPAANDQKAKDPDSWKVNEKIANPKVRQAIAYAVNREGIINGLLYGHGEKTNTTIARQFWAYSEDAPVDYTHDPGKAEQLLDQEGYTDRDGDGFREDPDGGKWVLNLDFPTGNKIRERTAPLLKQQLEEVGIRVNMRQPKEMTAYIDALENRDSDWDLFLLGWALDSHDPDPSSLWSSEAAYNYSRWNNEEADALLKQAMKAPEAFDQDYRKEVYADWQREFSEDLPALFLYVQDNLWVVNDRVEGIEPLPFTIMNNVQDWWVSR
ncbi:peptide-binding protein [Sporosarcina trichiuri]|uniref:peptide-binding protein n=1 Tax=Sporosarcina trichiuri TaxID=3056445 RepID=UPI0025B367FA|nr:peptide-binding protein [Sporosarcina sp. 0.2-SM1T-5]WJY26308.1 peptide-binding protein [Sporosarcina sp. 0.2-SM1T-5]